MSSSSSSDSEPEQKRKFKEAAIDAKDLFNVPSQTSMQPNAQNNSSRRFGAVQFSRAHNLNTTPEFRSFVAKKLYDVLERRIEFKKMKTDRTKTVQELNHEDKKGDWGFRLLSTADSNSKSTDEPKKQIQKSHSSSSDDSEFEKNCASVALSAETILSECKTFFPVCEQTAEKSNSSNRNEDGEKYDVQSMEKVNDADDDAQKKQKKKKRKIETFS